MHQLLAEQLEKIERGEINRLLIFAPPRSGKSLLVTQLFPAWFLGRNSHKHVTTAAYGIQLAHHRRALIQNQMRSEIYKEIFPSLDLLSDSKSKTSFSTIQGGGYFGTSVNGVDVKYPPHLFIIDDPYKSRQEAESKEYRIAIQNWYDTIWDKLMPESSVIIITSRWHPMDIGWYVLQKFQYENWVVLDFKAIAEENDILGRKIGESFWPEFYSETALESMKNIIGINAWNALYQQNPCSTW